MHSRLCLRLAGWRQTSGAVLHSSRATLSTTAHCRAGDPVRDIQDRTTPTTTPASENEPIPPRPANEPSDGRNPFLQGYPSSSGRQTTSTATPDSTTSEPAPEMRNRSNVTVGSSFPRPRRSNSNATGGLVDILSGKASRTSGGRIERVPNEPRAGGSAVRKKRDADFVAADKKLLAHQPRNWQPGDVYAPHDLSHIEAQKTMRARSTASLRYEQPPRRNGANDVLDALRVDPRRHYANFSMMAEFISDMGKIKRRFATQLRLKNQRRMAKAVRRAIGIGLVPSVHKHPELYEERAYQQGFAHGMKGMRSRGIR